MKAPGLYEYPRPVWARIHDRRASFFECVPKRFRRVATLFVTALLALLLLITLGSPRSSDPFTDSWGRAGHGGPPLAEFPASPMRAPNVTDWEADMQSKPWLAAVISTASDVDRRMLIRSTWMQLYRDVPYDARFVVANPGPRWTEMVRLENQTYGDMIVLQDIPEDRITANTIKTLELYKYLVDKHPRRYEFVSKIDSDLYLNARGFWNRYLLPRLAFNASDPSAAPTATVTRTTIGQLYYSRPNARAYPHGSMYTNTWDMVERLARLQDRHRVFAGEDRAVTLLLQRAGEVARLVNMRGTEKFDFDPDDTRARGEPWARAATHPDAKAHALSGTDAIAVHKVKDRDAFMQVAEAFDADGLRPAPPPVQGAGREKTPPFWTRLHDVLHMFGLSTHFETQVSRVPGSLWSRSGPDWICDGVWNMGPGKTGFQNDS